MKKIRINELARDLEVKAHLILDKLPDFGVTEKKTHSSSIDEDVAIKLRHFFLGDEGSAPAAFRESDGREEAAERAPYTATAVAEPEIEEQPAESAPPAPAAQEAAPQAEEPRAAEPAAETPRPGPVRPPMPLRPPLAGPHAGPQAPAVPGPPAPPPAPAMPAPPRAPEAPSSGGGSSMGRPVATPVKPLPLAPKPGQILTGPRQPFPAGPAPEAPRAMAPGAPRPAAPAVPRPPVVRPPAAPPGQPAQPPAATFTPGGAPGAPRPPQPRPSGLAGQPVQRPVVPPDPKLRERLQQTQARPGAPAPAAPRPGAPLRPQVPSSPVPGRPIYQGPIRPGQPMIARGPGGGPGGPGGRPGGPMRPGGPRPMHPTSGGRGLLPGAPPPAPDAARRPGGARPAPRGGRRPIEEQEGKLAPIRKSQAAGPPPINREITVSEGMTVKELSEKLDVKASLVIKKLLDRGIFATINQTLDVKLASEIAREFGASTAQATFEEEAMMAVESAETVADLMPRAPVVTIMGHVDHGKTSLLDAIREANVAAREAGGITQHIGAYAVEQSGKKIVFIDTPGHEAFTRMRARGAKVTDVVILVVAADDGVMPQTLEAIDHAKAARVPIIVAINKVDKPDAQPERIKQQLSDRGLVPEDWGGDTVMVPVSAKQKTNLDLLLEMILLVSEMANLKANPSRPATGAVLEAKLDRGRGPVATVLVRNGTLKVGDFFICGQVFGKVRAMISDRGETIKEAEPATPVEVLGLESLPEAGDEFQVVTDTAKAKQIVLYREAKARDAAMAKNNRLTLDQLHRQMREGEVKELPIILKADVGGSAEVLTDTLQKLSNDKVRIRVIHSGVGAINESDVLLASASNAIVIGFNVRPERNAVDTAERDKIDIRLHTIIYELTDELKKAMTGLLEPVYKETYRGRAEVREVFRVTKVGTVAGCLITDGYITRDSEMRLLRDNVVVHTGKIGSLRRFKDDVAEVKNGYECGITLASYSDVKQGDIIEAFVSERVAQEMLA